MIRNSDLRCVHPLPEIYKQPALELYVRALGEKLEPIFGPPSESLDFLLKHVDLNRAIGAIWQDQVVGILGLQDLQGGFLCPSMVAILDQYGLFAGLARVTLMMALDPQVRADQLYLDGIAVASEYRGLGIGSQLIAAFESYGRDQGFRSLILDVINTNPRARSLYLKQGYREVGSKSLQELGDVFPFQTSTQMEKVIRPD